MLPTMRNPGFSSQGLGTHPPARSAHRGYAPAEPEPLPVRLVQVVEPVVDRRERGDAGQDRADRDGSAAQWR